MRTTLISAAGAFALAAMAFSTGAQAQCLWTGFNWSCATAPPVYAQPYQGVYQYQYSYPPYPAYDSYYGYGYRPAWLGSYPGPRPSGH
jgi:hypothetical protein